MFDKEIEAIAKCTELIKDLDDNAKMRVMKYLIERFGIGMVKNPSSNGQSNGQSETKLIDSNENEDFEDIESENVESSNNFPSLKDLAIKDYPKGESEWILVYGYYSSNFGKDTFTRDDILSKYEETNRKTPTRRKNLSQSINGAIKKDWIKTFNENEFILLDTGRKYVQQILSGNSSGSYRKAKKTK